MVQNAFLCLKLIQRIDVIRQRKVWIGTAVYALQQWSGINVVVYYTGSIFVSMKFSVRDSLLLRLNAS